MSLSPRVNKVHPKPVQTLSVTPLSDPRNRLEITARHRSHHPTHLVPLWTDICMHLSLAHLKEEPQLSNGISCWLRPTWDWLTDHNNVFQAVPPTWGDQGLSVSLISSAAARDTMLVEKNTQTNAWTSTYFCKYSALLCSFAFVGRDLFAQGSQVLVYLSLASTQLEILRLISSPGCILPPVCAACNYLWEFFAVEYMFNIKKKKKTVPGFVKNNPVTIFRCNMCFEVIIFLISGKTHFWQ